MSTEPHHTEEVNDYTDKEIRVRPLFIFLMICLVITGLTFIGIAVLFKSLHEETRKADDLANAYSLERQLPQGGAVLQGFEEAARDLKALRDEEDAKLHSLEWVNQDSGIVRLPIDDAMVKVVEKGLPTAGAE